MECIWLTAYYNFLINAIRQCKCKKNYPMKLCEACVIRKHNMDVIRARLTQIYNR